MATLAIATFSFHGSVNAMTATIGWADTVSNSNISAAADALGQPDGTLVGFFDGSGSTTETATYTGFGSQSNYDAISLGSLLGVTDSVLGASDVVAFEYNGSNFSTNLFETSTWIFDDGSNSTQATYVFNTTPSDPHISAVGTISNGLYADFFGFANPFGNTGNYAFILFDIDGQSTVDPFAPGFSITLNATGSDAIDSPDIDALGVLSASPVPVPPAVWLFSSGLLGLIGIARKKSA